MPSNPIVSALRFNLQATCSGQTDLTSARHNTVSSTMSDKWSSSDEGIACGSGLQFFVQKHGTASALAGEGMVMFVISHLNQCRQIDIE
ncbi:hypothetical protein T265_07990 [Opisthorchis viverrini]|uniref:Uncharacterized protein n=1 Tax=Opisthorchis viverrini TaxID=6198 RepID=A0A075A9U0_OPIVI|nr:hypothetical protein T265_07990 [Opisthorchis viverrini]KER24304.1 hypothetical protein T265_07990 [Opisthorchis viverrini]